MGFERCERRGIECFTLVSCSLADKSLVMFGEGRGGRGKKLSMAWYYTVWGSGYGYIWLAL